MIQYCSHLHKTHLQPARDRKRKPTRLFMQGSGSIKITTTISTIYILHFYTHRFATDLRPQIARARQVGRSGRVAAVINIKLKEAMKIKLN